MNHQDQYDPLDVEHQRLTVSLNGVRCNYMGFGTRMACS